MTIVISDACTLNVSRSTVDDSRSINYKNIMIVNDTSRVVRMRPQLGASLTNDSRSVIYYCNMFIMGFMSDIFKGAKTLSITTLNITIKNVTLSIATISVITLHTVCQSVSLSVCQSVSLSVCQSVSLSVCQSVSLSVCQSVSLTDRQTDKQTDRQTDKKLEIC